ncbi:ArsR/SmtB family transcription factor [Bailinhaonella thermotolerans]|uniref:ArsR/SmtB family transcription factor n=1 Tax=Bailinhaonella thermotolerans TaxID=1070861 RepID=UPI001F5BB389|nr:DUF5937 family protein [Bailinhaonella thermotolerans]
MFKFGPEDVARVRFAFSPLWELVISLRTLRAPGAHALHLPWVRAVRPRLTALDLSELLALVPQHGYIPDFLTPPPTTPLPDFASELAAVRLTPPALAAQEVREVGEDGADPEVVARFLADPAAGVRRLADTLERFWELALAEYWPRIQGLLETDVLRRTRKLAMGGAAELFADLHPQVRWHGDRLEMVAKHCDVDDMGGSGLLLVPSVFAWPTIYTLVPPYHPMLAYPPDGVGTLWEASPPPAPDALAQLIGRTRAELLLSLGEPASTSALARRIGVTVGAVSQHLGVLHATGMVDRHRVGRQVLYRRTRSGDTLVAAP